MTIQLGPKGLNQGLKRILNLLVEEISLVDKAATRRKFLLVKRDVQDKPLEVSEGELRRKIFMGSEKTKTKTKETVELERTEELGLPPDAKRLVKDIMGSLAKVQTALAKLSEVKYKATYRSTTPGDDGDEDKAREDTENERKNAKAKDKTKEENPEEEDDDDDVKKKKMKKKSTETSTDKDIENAELSKEVEAELTELLSKVADSDESDAEKKKAQERINEIDEQMESDAGGED